MQTLLAIIRFITDTIFPPSHDALLVRSAKPIDLVLFMKQNNEVHGTETLLPFSLPLVRTAIHEAKFHGNKKAFMLLGHVLRERLLLLGKNEYLLVPIPLSSSRKRDRGYNQAAEIAKAALAGVPNVILRENMLKRTRNTKPQTELPKEKREENMRNAFEVVNSAGVAGKRIILFDDVATTGATLNAANRALEKCNPVSIICIALAH